MRSTDWKAYRPLPICTLRQPGETMPDYQARCLRFLLETDCTATLADDQLAQAEAAACRACAQTQDQTVLTILSAARHTIAAVLKFRAGLPAIVAPPAAPTTDDPIVGGWEAPLQRPRPSIPPSDGAAIVVPRAKVEIAF